MHFIVIQKLLFKLVRHYFQVIKSINRLNVLKRVQRKKKYFLVFGKIANEREKPMPFSTNLN